MGPREPIDRQLEPTVELTFTKISDERHGVELGRSGGRSERIELESRSFLRHDLAHFAVEIELPIELGYWGRVSRGASLDGKAIEGPDAELAEALAGPVQTLMRTGAGEEAYLRLLTRVVPSVASETLAAGLHERARRLRRHWKATPYGGAVRLIWPEPIPVGSPTA